MTIIKTLLYPLTNFYRAKAFKWGRDWSFQEHQKFAKDNGSYPA